MTIERTVAIPMMKPWGSRDLRPWSIAAVGGDPIGELWFQREGDIAQEPALLLKLLFTEAPLSIQVHPDDAFARSIGLANGKTEAWYILAAAPDAKVAIGLKAPLSSLALRAAIDDGSIADLVQWHPVRKGDFHFVPAGTIHAIGAGIVLAEIQQRSDATFRLFDYGRQRELHVDHAVAVARPAPIDTSRRKFDDTRDILVAAEHFVLEKIDCLPGSRWSLQPEHESWVLILEGEAKVGGIGLGVGDAVFVDADRADVEVGPSGMVALLAYPGPEFDSAVLRPQNDPGSIVIAGGSRAASPKLTVKIEVPR
jgi:mannose-6-phosphate isomerase